MQLFNSKTRQKEEFKSIVNDKVTIYACGPTVYNYFHIGNARAFITFDTLKRYFEYKGYAVTLVQNFTDIDDKMINGAKAEGITVKQLGDKYIEEYKKDAAALGIRTADVNPRATEHMDEIITLITKLVDKGLAYQSEDGVYFNTRNYQSYGELSGQDLDALLSGARVNVDENKKDPLDFALWKAYKDGEPFWESPFGNGRPGWHIECSAMSMKYLGETIDIHGGGQDLIFPHHENELAQSKGATGKPLANYWLHNGFLNIDNEKMSKSLGNFFTVRDIAKVYDLDVVRYFLLSAHYRTPLNFSREMIDQAAASLGRLKVARNNWDFLSENAADGDLTDKQKAFAESLPSFKERFIACMDDDLNTAGALGVIFDLVREGNTLLGETDVVKTIAKDALSMLNELCDVLNLFYAEKRDNDDEAQLLVQKRDDARKQKDWASSDAIRLQLQNMGYSVEDTAQGTRILKK